MVSYATIIVLPVNLFCIREINYEQRRKNWEVLFEIMQLVATGADNKML
jgi:hypothetical protein